MNNSTNRPSFQFVWLAIACLFFASSTIDVDAFGSGTIAKNSPLFSTTTSTSTTLQASTAAAPGDSKKKKPYVPKWVKKETLAESAGDTGSLGFDGVGLKGTIPVVFKQGNETRTSMAWAGQPIRDVASQAGQFIQYGCGKGECGTCECMMGGKWVRPCVEKVPASAEGAGDLVLQIKAIKSRKTSSGTFFSIKSFFMGFYNNLLGMFGFLRFRKKASANWDERRAYEDLVAQKAMEKKLARQREAEQGNGNANGGNPAPGMA
uniref:2Fe-2S ferredoxin-type domain-containing protein n=1 Tax=Pseudo-nitzschia australis TaxID=44445 RepID=A0A6V0BM12_9STRA|mmetsp:Transcript_5922/g.12847  ORF Transcript_5922/g.12847 Transcript_5922/m.12847 type:complete len:263 (+) Transcript_5922:231-1019(+)|eukprot:CAMPEP_0168203840 /NCGR_PEP_ID=MMETSP0139_2-20121125/25073_1 /TAXON_ID=44445 /ORGANISM="Pseudo-nitzschia australis, Strain 10249 10 AB" /LENGTH=262 /DNA_ID=CAMNT_0008129727 /DNA_START=238 /DNA_END=1026 /DNA_ORIENTATION=+